MAATLLFDLDDTLIADTLDAHAAVNATCAAHVVDGVEASTLASTVIDLARAAWPTDQFGGAIAHELGISSIEALYADFDRCHERPRRLRDVQTSYRQTVWGTAFARHGRSLSTCEIDGVIGTFRSLRIRSVTVYDEVHDVLGVLAGTYRLGIITNGPADLQRDKLGASGLADYFGTVVISGELGRGKPSPAPFLAAMTALGADPATTTMVGDNPERDMAGAAAAGIRSVCVTRTGGLRCDLSDHHPIADLRPLLDLDLDLGPMPVG